MKKIILSLLLTSFTAFVFGQSITLSPKNISVQKPYYETIDDLLLTRYAKGIGEGPHIIGRHANGGSATSPVASFDGSYLLHLGGRGYTGSGFTTSSSSSMRLGTTQSWTPTATGSAIIFSTTANNTTLEVERMTINHDGNIAIGNHTPLAKLHVDGDFALKKKVLLSGNGGHSNYDRNGASVISIATPANGGGGETLSGIADGVDGLIIHIYPVQGTSITLAHESASSLAINRIITQTTASVTITNNGGATLMYDSSVSRWRVIGIAN